MEVFYDWNNVGPDEMQLLQKVFNSIAVGHDLVIEFHNGDGSEFDGGEDDPEWEITESVGTKTLKYSVEYTLLRSCESFLDGGYGIHSPA